MSLIVSNGGRGMSALNICPQRGLKRSGHSPLETARPYHAIPENHGIDRAPAAFIFEPLMAPHEVRKVKAWVVNSEPSHHIGSVWKMTRSVREDAQHLASSSATVIAPT
ncbi:hypothetical protein [Shinella zoogloeoides]|uniref:hypothetical protein n=1 Tax=Shinella zoogloeoides TaxID=352475 RepID=UPI00299D1827|nr:hypothetical protein [Shinella zoogloeoides]